MMHPSLTSNASGPAPVHDPIVRNGRDELSGWQELPSRPWVIGCLALACVVACSCGHDWDSLEQEVEAQLLEPNGAPEDARKDGIFLSDVNSRESESADGSGSVEAGDAERESHKKK
jgi:hypothetical protein